MKRILFYAKHSRQIEANAKILNSDFSEFKSIDLQADITIESVELDVMTKVFFREGWECCWTCLEWLDFKNKTIMFFNPLKETIKTVGFNKISSYFAVIVFRIIGSVEGKRDFINKAIDSLQENFSGLMVNHPETMKYGIRKDYIFELQKSGFPVIPTKYYENTVTLDALTDSVDNLCEYVIKPTTGELSNSLTTLDKVDKAFLRKKKNKVGGWLVQPLVSEIWDGEYQLVFFRDNFSHGCRKMYTKVSSDMLLPSQDHRDIDFYNPEEKETELALSIKAFFEKNLSKPIYTFRFDYLKMRNGDIKILEFEVLNPGFFIGYLKDDTSKFNVANKFASEIENILN